VAKEAADEFAERVIPTVAKLRADGLSLIAMARQLATMREDGAQWALWGNPHRASDFLSASIY
jgi:hypothetical protein